MSACKICSSKCMGEYCFRHKPRKPLQAKKPMKKVGRVSKSWQSAKELWWKKHPSGTFKCFYCKRPLERTEVTLDHFLSRGRRPELRNELSNLVVACWPCNNAKGSLSGDEYLERIKNGRD